MSVAKSYANYPIIGGPYEKSKRFYVLIQYPCCKKKTCSKCGGTGSYAKEVRWYDEKISERSFDGRTAFGFGEEGYITLLKGPRDMLEKFFKEEAPRQARYNLLFSWYIPSCLPILSNLPEGISLIRLGWDEISENNEIKEYNIIKKIVEGKKL